jgi:hypothetical protein
MVQLHSFAHALPATYLLLIPLQVDHELDTQNFEHFDEDMSMQVSSWPLMNGLPTIGSLPCDVCIIYLSCIRLGSWHGLTDAWLLCA